VVDVFVDDARASTGHLETPAVSSSGSIRVQSARDFVPRHLQQPYDLGVYHLEDTAASAFVWPYAFLLPGLTVLHDGRLHSSRSRALVQQQRPDDYRAEFAWNHPDVPAAAAELAVSGYDSALGCQWPMVRGLLTVSRLVLTHNRGAMPELQSAAPDAPLVFATASDGGTVATDADREAARTHVRDRLHVAADAVLFCAVDGPAVPRRIPAILRAFVSALTRQPGARLVIAGEAAADPTVGPLVAELGLQSAVVLVETAAIDREGLTQDALVAAADVVLALRWPAALDMPATFVRALAAGRPCVLVDLAHLADIPTLDPRTWRRHAPLDPLGDDGDAVGIAVDIMDEDHSLRLALPRLATDAALRSRLGQAGHRHWLACHRPAQMIDDYEKAIERAVATAAPHVADMPAHLRPDRLRRDLALAGSAGDASRARVASGV